MSDIVQRVADLASDLVGQAFVADWHDDPDVGVKEIDRVNDLFARRIFDFVRDEIKRAAISPSQGDTP
jgi:hypothetical protein